MKTVRKTLDIAPYENKILNNYLGKDRFAVFDIETTGLSPNYGAVILSGFVLVDKNKTELIQFFAYNPLEELEVLKATAEIVESVDYLVTFNGRMFDIPFLVKRCLKYGIDIKSPFNLDLFILMKHYSGVGKLLPRLRQKDLEEYGGIAHFRDDRISGGESVDLYATYQNIKSNELAEKIMLHNSDDVTQLFRLLCLLNKVDIHKAFHKTGFPIPGGRIKSISLKGQDLLIEALSNTPKEYIGFPTAEQPYTVRASRSDCSLEIAVPCEKRKNDIYVDLYPLFSRITIGTDSSVHSLIEFVSQEKISETNNIETNNINYDVIKKALINVLNSPNYINGYLVLKEAGELNYLDLNMLSKALTTLVLDLINQ